MESYKIYERSYTELQRIKETLGTDYVSINFDVLDGQSKQLLYGVYKDQLAAANELTKDRLKWIDTNCIIEIDFTTLLPETQTKLTASLLAAVNTRIREVGQVLTGVH